MSDFDPNETLRQLYDRIEAASSEGLTEVALAQCEEALELLDENEAEVEEFTHADFLMLAGHTHWVAGNLEDAQRSYRGALEYEPDRIDALLAVGVTLFHLCRFEAARAQLEVVSAEEPEVGEAWYYLALLALRRNDPALADNFFRRANELEPERWELPVQLPFEEVVGIVRNFYNDMPPELRKALEGVPILAEERPAEALLYSNDPPLDPLLLGLFDGTPLPEQSVFSVELAPPHIYIFTENISLLGGTREKLEEELWITLKHEIGHYFGLSEEELAERGLE
ncbi:MAG: metallopeptidase family protein [Candidatus Sumerlaeia bacterium]|nr:metallopeptidase family protein [Candidatus Sumerlaeia bacterium]